MEFCYLDYRIVGSGARKSVDFLGPAWWAGWQGGLSSLAAKVWLLRFSKKKQLQEPKESHCDLQKQTGILLYQNSVYFIREKSRGKMLLFYFILVDFLMLLKLWTEEK